MNRIFLALTLALLILFSIIIAGVFLVDLAEDEEAVAKLYTYPISIGKKPA